MRTVLFLTSSLEYGGTARQLTLLAAGLPRDRFRPRVCVLGRSAPWVDALRAVGVEVDVLGWSRPIDPRPLLALHRLLRGERSAIVHVWGAAALRALAAADWPTLGRALVSASLGPSRRPSRLDAWLTRQARRVVALGAAEADRYRRAGVAADRLAVLPPGTGIDPDAPPPAPADLPGVPAGMPLVLGIGPIEPFSGFREGVWALDILHYLHPNLHLALAGSGSDRERVEAFSRSIGVWPQVHFLGPVADVAPLLQRADFVWVPSLRGGGRCAALEAMAAGRPVIASRLPELAEVVVEGGTGFLVPPGDKPALARQTRVLVEDAGLRQRLGEAGRKRVAAHFTASHLVRHALPLYGDSPDPGGVPT